MVLMTPNLSERKSGIYIKKSQYKQSYSKTYFSRRFCKKKSNQDNFTETTFKPLTATSNNSSQLAFKGLNVYKLLTESRVKKADDLLQEILQKVHPPHIEGEHTKLNGLRHLIGYMNRAVNPKTGKSIKEDNISVVKPLRETFPEALLSVPRLVSREFQKLFGGKELRNRLITAQRNKEKLDNLLGYYLQVEKIGKTFDKTFSGKTLEQLKGLLKKGDHKAIHSFLESNGIKSKVLLGHHPSDAKAFEEATKELLKKLRGKNSIKELLKKLSGKSPIEDIRKDYITGVINKEEWAKAGSLLPCFSNSSAQVVNRASTGIVTGVLVANDFYNLKMLTTDDKEKAEEKRNQMFKQQAAYTILSAYIGYMINSTFIRMVNSSLKFAVAVGAATAVASNIISRKINGIPILPIHHKQLSKDPYVIHAASIQEDNSKDYSMPQYKHSKTFRAFKGNVNNSLSFSGYSLSGIKASIEALDTRLARAMPAKMSYEDFVKGLDDLREVNPQFAEGVIKIAARHMKHIDPSMPERAKHATLKHIKKAAKANNGEVIIGRSSLYKFGKAVLDTILFPVKLLIGLGRMSINLVLKAMGKTPIPKPKSENFGDETRVRNFFKWAKKAKAKSEKTGIGVKEAFGENFSRLRGPDVMEYSNDKLSTAMKGIGFITVPFLTMDAYNTSAEETKNMHLSVEKAKQRSLQDTSRQGISYWLVKSWNNIFKPLNNHSLLGAGVSTTLSCSGYEILTRVLVGQPITPKTHEEMKAIEKQRLKNDSWLARALGRKVKTHEDEDKVVLNSERLREFPGMKPGFHPPGFKLITRPKNADKSGLDSFINNLTLPPSFELN